MVKVSWVILTIIFLALAWKNPFNYRQNLISNFEPGPDTFYYSVPAWNWVKGVGFKMAVDNEEIRQIVPPLYGVILSPVFYIWRDARAYFFVNIILGLTSIWLYLKVAEKLLAKVKTSFWLLLVSGILLVTNFYFYNLPSLLMAENVLIPLTLGAVYLMFGKIGKKEIRQAVVLSGLLLLTKISAFPVVGVMWLIMIIKTKNFRLVGVAGAVVLIMALVAYVLNGKVFLHMGDFYNWQNFVKFFPRFVGEFFGINGSYLWYRNQQVETVLGVVGLIGAVVGLIKKETRAKTAVILAFIAAVVVFHSFMFIAEGRFISTVVPLCLLLSVVPFMIIDLVLPLLVFMMIYLMGRVTVNGFEERKVTSLKRQTLNNRLEQNEISWNYWAVDTMNKYFTIKDEKVYMATLLPPFYLMMFGNGNYGYLPLSVRQEFAGQNKGLIEKYYEEDGTIVSMYRRIINRGSEVYFTDYYKNNFHGSVDGQVEEIWRNFDSERVFWGCDGLCNIYRLKQK